MAEPPQTVDKPCFAMEKACMGGCEGGRESPCTFNSCKNRNIFRCFGFCLSSCRHFVDSLNRQAEACRLVHVVLTKRRGGLLQKNGRKCGSATGVTSLIVHEHDTRPSEHI